MAYVYNGANQIQCVDGNANGLCTDPTDIVYQYDDYGNLLDDGVSIYTYDAAMRLKTVSSGGILTTYTYNGDGDRVSQTVDLVTTTYTLDVATPLTMVLAEQTGTADPIYYLHGLGLVAQSDGTTIEYFNVDGLGSVRQLTDEDGDVLLAQSFDPYGSPYQSAGADITTYGWAGEQSDENGLIYLRARFYAPGMGRFLNTDPSRMEMNPYWYSAGNPVNWIDPSGLIFDDPMERQEAYRIIDQIARDYRIIVEEDFGFVPLLNPEGYLPGYMRDSSECPGVLVGGWELGQWEIEDLREVKRAFLALESAFQRVNHGSLSTELIRQDIARIWGGTYLRPSYGRSNAVSIRTINIQVGPSGWNGINLRYYIIHELGHEWDKRLGLSLSRDLSTVVGRKNLLCLGYNRNPVGCFSSGEVPPGLARQNYAAGAPWEDFAESFAAYVVPGRWSSSEQLVQGGIRWQFIERLLRHKATRTTDALPGEMD